MSKVTITRIEFKNFKAFSRYSISLSKMNVLVGPNNSGKSTILNAIRVLNAGIRRANAKNAVPVAGPEGYTYGHIIPTDSIPISLENVHTNYDESTPTTIIFHLSNNTKLMLYFPIDGNPVFIPMDGSKSARTASHFKKIFPLKVDFVPVMGPVEYKEELISKQTVQNGLVTHRASRHFRNYWYYFPEKFEDFSEKIRKTWPGMDIKFPEIIDHSSLVMFCSENRIDREIYWSGFGFQIWCQLMTHIVRSSDADLLVIDEPEIYLHPDLQRQLLFILKEIQPNILLATHSAEIISESDPLDIVIINKSLNHSQRLKDIDQIQHAMNILGSNQNIALTRLSKTRRVLFIEGDDFKILSKFAQKTDFPELVNKIDLTVVPIKDFVRWEDVRSLIWGIEQTLGTSLALGTILDRNYRCDEEVQSIHNELKSNLKFLHIYKRKNIESYLINIDVIDRVLKKKLVDNPENPNIYTENFITILNTITDTLKPEFQTHYISNRIKFFNKSSLDQTSIINQALLSFEEQWIDIEKRMNLIDGKLVLSEINTYLLNKYNITITNQNIISEFKPNEIPEEIVQLFRNLDRFRRMPIQ
ncbi:ATP-dependent nuclease [Herpetosiphon llansteffanensis]|uniref:ATP-dependent nuclease n=1 Tax=Herpetosiphon llansteffanensis TaxID=2094568 RepID=UPI000D7C1497|nr:ATP-binding protein [Herpetosiphon llansteffanensis]